MSLMVHGVLCALDSSSLPSLRHTHSALPFPSRGGYGDGGYRELMARSHSGVELVSNGLGWCYQKRNIWWGI